MKDLDRIQEIRSSIENEDISWEELLFLQQHQDIIKTLGDPVLAEWAGIPEKEFYAHN